MDFQVRPSSALTEVKGDKARLCSVAERTRHLFGKDEAAPGTKSRRKKKPAQKTLFEELDETESVESGWSEMKGPALGETVLDRVHQSMILFAAGRTEAVKRFLVEDGEPAPTPASGNWPSRCQLRQRWRRSRQDDT